MVQYPDLYAAGIAWVGVSDLFDMYENTMPHFRTELMVKNLGEPDENEALYRERSPVTHVENLDAPLLIVHGVNDPRVPVSQARILRDALDDAGFEEGVDYEYEELGEEGHGFRRHRPEDPVAGTARRLPRPPDRRGADRGRLAGRLAER